VQSQLDSDDTPVGRMLESRSDQVLQTSELFGAGQAVFPSGVALVWLRSVAPSIEVSMSLVSKQHRGFGSKELEEHPRLVRLAFTVS
jgi:hypothetical protein